MRRLLCTLIAVIAVLALGGAAYASFGGLPSSGSQINDDPPSIDPAQNAGLADLTAGSLVAGNARVPWAAFSQTVAGAGEQIFVRAFKAGAWHTEGFPESLNEDATQNALSPSIDFTGPDRTVPWVTWAEPSSKFSSVSQIFASRFLAQPGGQNDGQWVHEGQEAPGTAPSLNINTNRDADVPSLVGGAANPTLMPNPAPWITWQEADNGNTRGPSGLPSAPRLPGNSTFQIFVEHAVPAPTGSCPLNTKPAHGTASVGHFCFQQVGIDRVKNDVPTETALDPSLNVDPSRDGIQADIAFTGANDAVPWVVWYENSDNGTVTDGLLNADMVFAARGIIGDSGGDGGFHWQVVGLGTQGKTATQDILNTTGANNHAGDCAESQAAELACSLNADQTLSDAQALTDGNGGENPSIAAGTLVPGHNTTPWIAWDESTTNHGLHSVFVARLDSAGDHFDLLNNGQAISHSAVDATRPDIVFSHNTPYVSWKETTGGTTLTFVGHFEGDPANPVFHLDTQTGIPSTATVTPDDDHTDVRSPIASTCAADPFNGDGAACQGGAIGTPFFAFTNGSPRALFGQAYQPDALTTLAASGVRVQHATLNGSVNPAGGPVEVEFQYGATPAYRFTTTAQLLLPASVPQTFSAALTGLKPGPLHFRAVAITDFGTFTGADQTVAIPPPKVSSRIVFPHGNVKAKNAIAIIGTATASLGVAKVLVAVVQYSHGAHVAAKHKPACAQLGRDGRLHQLSVGRNRGCTPTVWLTATGTTNWHLKLTRPLPRGTYVVISQAIDTAGNRERIGDGDIAHFKLS